MLDILNMALQDPFRVGGDAIEAREETVRRGGMVTNKLNES
jgi:hypothetical protein